MKWCGFRLEHTTDVGKQYNRTQCEGPPRGKTGGYSMDSGYSRKLGKIG